MPNARNSSESSSSENLTPGTPPDKTKLTPAFWRLCEVVAKLRSPEGCPWDRQQTLETIKPYTLEETYELLDAIDSNDDAAIVEELGDVLLQVILDAQITADAGRFTLLEVVEGLIDKLVRRHPHVFGNATAETAADVISVWDQQKAREKHRESIFDGLPTALPALARTIRITDRAGRVGFDFPHRDMLFDKLREEVAELARELFPDAKIPEMPATVDSEPTPDEPIDDPERAARVEDEIGDILFVLGNIARRWKVNPEDALRKSNRKFERRFQFIEQELAKQDRNLRDATLQEMEDLYQQLKRQERG